MVSSLFWLQALLQNIMVVRMCGKGVLRCFLNRDQRDGQEVVRVKSSSPQCTL